MALASNNIVTIRDIVNKFNTEVKNKITNGVYDVNNIPFTAGGYQCIPTSLLDSISSIPDPAVGVSGNIITSGKVSSSEAVLNSYSIYASFIYITKILTRVGTFTYTRKRKVTNDGVLSYDNIDTLSGKAFFTLEYAKTCSGFTGQVTPEVDDANVRIDKIFNANNISQLAINCYNNHGTSVHPSYVAEDIYCHSDCHDNCHSNCYNDCHGQACHSACYMNHGHFSECHSGYCYSEG